MIGGLVASAADLPTRAISDRYNVEGCTKRGHMNDVWVFNPKGWSRDQILGDAKNLAKYAGKADTQILPRISGFLPASLDHTEYDNLEQTFEDFRLYDDVSSGISIQEALDEGWECTGVQGNWCRKPFLNRKVLKLNFIAFKSHPFF